MRRIQPIATAFGIVALLPFSALAQPAGAYDQFEFLLPIEVTQGLITDRGTPIPYTGSLRVYPSLTLDDRGRARVGASTAVTYRNPDWEFMAGARFSYRVATIGESVVGGVGLDLAVEGLLGMNGGDEIGVEVGFDLDGFFRLGVRGARDVSRGEYLIEMAIGADPLSWFSGAPEDP